MDSGLPVFYPEPSGPKPGAYSYRSAAIGSSAAAFRAG
jgi:hypothetical protein